MNTVSFPLYSKGKQKRYETKRNEKKKFQTQLSSFFLSSFKTTKATITEEKKEY